MQLIIKVVLAGILSTVSVLVATQLGLETVYAQSNNRSKWSNKDARKVIGRALRHAPSGLVSIRHDVSLPRLQAVWLTDDVCWAISRIVQYEERRADEEVTEVYEDCRRDAKESYSVYVSAYEVVFSEVPTTRAERERQRRLNTSEDRIRYKKTEEVSSQPAAVNHRLDQIFLQRRDNRDVFVRPSRIDMPPEYFSYLQNYAKGEHFDTERDVILVFPRNRELVKDAKDIDIQMRQGGRQLRLKFSLKNLRANKGRLANL